MSKHYQHTQIGYLIIVLFGAVIIFISAFMLFNGFYSSLFTVLIIFILCLCLFCTLTIVIDKDFLVVKFGLGIIKKKFLIKDIISCLTVKNQWYYGWGIRLIPGGWLFNVSGFKAIEITLRSGKRYRIGTDIPDEIEKKLRGLIKKKK